MGHIGQLEVDSPRLGQKVILNTLLRRGDFPGEIIEVSPEPLPFRYVCTVKLECQESPVRGALYYDEQPKVVDSSLWQICWPKEEEGGAVHDRDLNATRNIETEALRIFAGVGSRRSKTRVESDVRPTAVSLAASVKRENRADERRPSRLAI